MAPPLTPRPPRGSADNRKEPRHNVQWPGRLTLPTGQVIEARIRDISEQGLGFLVDYPIPSNVVMPMVLGVPNLQDLTQIMGVPVKVKPMYVVMNGTDFRVGGVWVDLPANVQTLVQDWIKKLSSKV